MSLISTTLNDSFFSTQVPGPLDAESDNGGDTEVERRRLAWQPAGRRSMTQATSKMSEAMINEVGGLETNISNFLTNGHVLIVSFVAGSWP